VGEAGGSVPAAVVVLDLRAHIPRCQKLGIQGQAPHTLSVWGRDWEIYFVCAYVHMFTHIRMPY